MKRFLKLSFFVLTIALLFASCKANLKPYERVYVNDIEMQMQQNNGFVHYVHSIREGSVRALTKKGNGGCGCN